MKDDSSSPENMAGVSLKNGKLVLASNEETVLCDYTKGKTVHIRILLNAETDKYSAPVEVLLRHLLQEVPRLTAHRRYLFKVMVLSI